MIALKLLQLRSKEKSVLGHCVFVEMKAVFFMILWRDLSMFWAYIQHQECDTPYDKDKGRWCVESRIAWEEEVIALYNVPIGLQLYH